MTIRNRLTWLFTLLVASLLTIFCLTIYFFAEIHRQQEFYQRLRQEAFAAVDLLYGQHTISPELFKLLDKNERTVLNQEEIIIYNHQNRIVYESGTDYLTLSRVILDRVQKEREVRLQRGSREIAGILFHHSPRRFVVFASAVDKYGFSKQRNLAFLLVAGWLMATGAVWGTGRYFAGKALQPVRRVIGQVDNITASRLDMRVDEGNGEDEMAQLARTFNRMLDRLEEAFRMQQAFVSDASHELRTPLTAITGQIQVALLAQEDPKELRDALVSVLEDVRGMNRLVNGLLNLADVSLYQSGLGLNPVRVDELVWQVRSELLKGIPDSTVLVELTDWPEHSAELSLPGNEPLLRIAIFNLMENGCKFSPERTVWVRLLLQAEYFTLSFHNNGPAIPEDERQLIFKPFHRGRNAHWASGHGIGLSLTERIVHLHRGSLILQSEASLGTTFTLILPRHP